MARLEKTTYIVYFAQTLKIAEVQTEPVRPHPHVPFGSSFSDMVNRDSVHTLTLHLACARDGAA